MPKNLNDNLIETPGDRLNIVITKYFETQKEVSGISGVDTGSLSSYISGRYNITKKLTNKLQKTTGISSDYLLNGNLPMMLDDTRKQIISRVSKIDAKQQHGITTHLILQYEGDMQILKFNGESSVVNLVLGNLEETPLPFQVFNNLLEFAEDYDIPLGSTLILKRDYKNKNLVLFTDKENYRLGIYNKKQVTDIKDTSKSYHEDNIDIAGRVVGIYKNIRYNEKTGRIF